MKKIFLLFYLTVNLYSVTCFSPDIVSAPPPPDSECTQGTNFVGLSSFSLADNDGGVHYMVVDGVVYSYYYNGWHDKCGVVGHNANIFSGASCSCNLPNINSTVDLTQWQLFDTAINEDSLNQVCFNNSNYLIETTRTDCVSTSKCYSKILEYYDCSALGNNWSRADAQNSNDCTLYATDSDYNNDSVQWHTGTDILDTCCVHGIDNNDTGGNDSNGTGGTGGNDSNGTGGTGGNDSNGTGGTGGNDTSSDLGTINNSINSSATTAHEDSMAINDSINSSATTAHEDSMAINDSINSSATTAHEDSSNLQASIDNFSSRNHDDLSTLADILRGDGSGDGKIDEALNAYSNILNNAYETIPQKFNSLVGFTFGAVPAFAVSNGDCSFSADLSYGVYTVNLNEYSALISPYTSVLFSLLFIFISIKWWYKSFLIILKVL